MMKGWGRIEGVGRRKKGWRRRSGEVRTDNKPVLICCPIRTVKLNSSAKRGSGGPSGLLSALLHFRTKTPLNFSSTVQQIFKL